MPHYDYEIYLKTVGFGRCVSNPFPLALSYLRGTGFNRR